MDMALILGGFLQTAETAVQLNLLNCISMHLIGFLICYSNLDPNLIDTEFFQCILLT